MHLKTVFASVLFAACAAFSAFGEATGTQRLYVDSNGGEYINTGFTPNANTSIAVQYQLLQAPDSSHNDYVFSEYGPSNNGRFQFVHLLDDKVFCGYGAGYRRHFSHLR